MLEDDNYLRYDRLVTEAHNSLRQITTQTSYVGRMLFNCLSLE